MEVESYEAVLERMKQTFREQAGFEADDASDVGIRLKVLAGEVFSLLHSMEWLQRQIFPQTAQGEYLTMHGVQRGLKRKAALTAQGSLTFSRRTSLSYDLAIPKGTVCSTGGETPLRFQTTVESVLKAGYCSVQVQASAVEPGAVSNAAVDTVTVMVTPPAGIESVTNAEPFSGGVDGESDEELRERLLKSYAQVSNGTNAEFYRSYAMQYDGIDSASVVSRENGTGTVSLYLAARGGTPDEALLTQIQEELNALREINVDVTVKAAKKRSVRVACYIKPAVGYTFAEIKPLCQTAIQEYYQGLKVGQPVFLTHMGRKLLDTGVVRNYQFYSTSADVRIAETEIAVMGTTVLNEMTSGI